jgi:hypothetical protein
MTDSLRKVIESPQYQGTAEIVAYVFDWTKNGSPSSATTILKDKASSATLGTTYLSGTTTVVGVNVTTPLVQGLLAGKEYRLETVVTINTNTLGAYCDLIGE